MYYNLYLAMTCLYFVVTGVQYWVPSYMLIAINQSPEQVNLSFIICAGTAPTMGVFFGGWLVDRLGGYREPKQRVKALKICLIFGRIEFIHILCTV